MSTTTPAGGPAPLPIADFTAELLGRYAAAGCRAKTINTVRRALDLLVKLAGVRTTADIDNEAVRRFIVAQRDQNPGSFFANICTLKDALSDAAGLGLLHNPPDIAPAPRPGGHITKGRAPAGWIQDPRRLRRGSAPAGKAAGPGGTAESGSQPLARSWSEPVVLGGPGDNPVVLGNPKPPLTKLRRRLIEALLAAGRAGLSLAALQNICGSPRKVLKTLRGGDPDWRQVIHFPGTRSKGGYWVGLPAPPA